MEVTAAGTVPVPLAAAAWAAAAWAAAATAAAATAREEEATETEAADSEATTRRILHLAADRNRCSPCQGCSR